MRNIYGEREAKLDNKGRVFVPADFRKILQTAEDQGMFLRKDLFEDCLVLYPAHAWEDEVALYRSTTNRYSREDQQAVRQLIQGVHPLEIDASGRILIPKRYLEMAGITTDVRFSGLGQTIQIWDPERADQQGMKEGDFKEHSGQLKTR